MTHVKRHPLLTHQIVNMQREEPDAPEVPQKVTPIKEEKAVGNTDALEISFDLPGQKKINLDSIILNSPEQQKTSSSEEEWLDVDTGEPASASKVGPIVEIDTVTLKQLAQTPALNASTAFDADSLSTLMDFAAASPLCVSTEDIEITTQFIYRLLASMCSLPA